MKKLTICIDVDGTIVVSQYPKIGNLMLHAKETINKWYDEGHTIVIGTCRAGQMAEDAEAFLIRNNIKYHYFNENAKHLIEKYGTDTRKLSGDIYFDDKSMGGFCGWDKADEYVSWFANRKPIIICVTGESGSGKTKLCEYIETKFGVTMIESYTDRPKRKPDETGHTFIDKAEFDLLNESDMIAWTKFGDYRYCCLKSDVRDQNTYTIDERGVLLLMANFRHEYDLKLIRVKCDEDVRLMRVGDMKRIERDRGVFLLPDNFFTFVLDTTNLELGEYPIELDRTIAGWLNLGWSY